ncbi:MAG TPA: hypothetical protein VM327_08750 [Candidatus Thermoplasmatota archaeon]|nr:hypothetical protein [Candidatus Thermoplasmatota archaeon]
MRALRLVLPLLLFVVAGLAGCASQDAGPGGPDPFDQAEQAIGEPRDDGGVVAGAPDSVNLERLVALTGEDGRTPPPGEGYVETAVKGGYAYLCRTGPEQGLVVFDVHDIEHPRYTGFVTLHAGFEADIEVSDDGQWAFWETQRAYLSTPPVPPSTDPAANAPHGIHVVDLSDKTAPTWVSFTPILPDGPHSITYANISGEHYVFASAYAYAYVSQGVAVPGLQRLVILHLDTSGPTPRLVQVAEYMDPDAAEESPKVEDGQKFPHDVAFQYHPLTRQPLAYVAYWDLGVVILDVSDPAHPVKVGQASDFGETPYADIHMARPFPHLIAGRHVTVTEPEISGQEDTGYYTFFDTTDPTKPVYLSRWKIPGNGTSGGAGGGGPHYFDANFGRIVTAHYGAGFWVADVHDATNLLRPRTTAYAMPKPGVGDSLPGPLGAFTGGSAFDAWWADPTHVIASESSSGLVVFRYTGPAPEPVTTADS